MATLMTIDAVMARLGVRRKAVMRLLRTGQLTAYKVGRSWRFEPKDIDAYLRSVKFTPRTVSTNLAPARRRARAHTKEMSAGANRYM